MSPYFGLNLGQLLACFVSGVFAEQTARGAAVRAHALLGAVAVVCANGAVQTTIHGGPTPCYCYRGGPDFFGRETQL